MLKLSEKEIRILRFIRRSRHKTTAQEIAAGVALPKDEVEAFLQGMVSQKLINLAPGATPAEDAYYTNPEKREDIYGLVG